MPPEGNGQLSRNRAPGHSSNPSSKAPAAIESSNSCVLRSLFCANLFAWTRSDPNVNENVVIPSYFVIFA